MTQKISTGLLYGAVVVAILAFMYLLGSQTPKTYGSTIMGNDYNATTTFAASVPVINLIKTGQGSLNAVVITGKNTGLAMFYNATTSNVLARTGNKATSTIMIADFPTNAPEGTYTFDAQFTDGLLFVGSGNIATSTILYR